MQMKDKRHPLCATGMVVDASRKMQMKDKRHPLRAKGYLILYMGADRFITSTSDLALIIYHWRLIICRTLISLRLSVMNPPPMKAFLRVKSSTVWLTKAVDIAVS